jgi:flagellar hook-associated protein 3 FlgL
MDTTRISSLAFNSLLRGSTIAAKAELAARSEEATTGRLADAGLSLGAGTGRLRSLSSLHQHLSSIDDANALAGGRLSATQAALEGLSGLTTDMMSLLSAGDMLTDANAAKLATARESLASATGFANTSYSGVSLFGGVRTSGPAVSDWESGAAQTVFRDAFSSRFGFDISDAAAASISAADMSDFLETTARPMFEGPDWTTNLSSASDEALRSRIAPGESAVTSVNANESSVRALFMATAVTFEFLGSHLGAEAAGAVSDFALSSLGEANKGLADLQGRVGVMQQRVTRASEAGEARLALLNSMIDAIKGVDPYEAASRVNELTTRLETSYTLTARLQDLSLVRYLG